MSQSILYPASAPEWLAMLSQVPRVVSLASAASTLSIRLPEGMSPQTMRHELVRGLYRTVWETRIESLDLMNGSIVAVTSDAHFSSFRHELRWETSSEGLAVHSELSWTTHLVGLDEFLRSALLRFPQPVGSSPRFGDMPTRRLVLDDRSISAA